jgi:hypothetical protein
VEKEKKERKGEIDFLKKKLLIIILFYLEKKRKIIHLLKWLLEIQRYGKLGLI